MIEFVNNILQVHTLISKYGRIKNFERHFALKWIDDSIKERKKRIK